MGLWELGRKQHLKLFNTLLYCLGTIPLNPEPFGRYFLYYEYNNPSPLWITHSTVTDFAKFRG